MNGIFAFALYDKEKDCYLIARDHIGIVPLYVGWDQHGNFFVASELKALEGFVKESRNFFRGIISTARTGLLTDGISGTGWNMMLLRIIQPG